MQEQNFEENANHGASSQSGSQSVGSAQANFSQQNSFSAQEMPNDIQSNAVHSSPVPPRKKRTRLYVIIAIVVILLIGGGVYAYTSHTEATEEEMAYEVLENNDNPQDYQDFLNKYPNSVHAEEVKQRLAKLEEMIQKWNSIALSENVNDFINFKNTYPDAQYGRFCDIKIDSLDFVNAQKIGTSEAYQHYLDAHPDGRYASEASIAQGSLHEQEISVEEQTAVVNVLNDFFNGFSNQDESRICSNISSTMTTFLHQRNANKATVLKTINAMFNEHIQGCQFNVNRDLQLTRDGATGGYIATFTVDQHIQRDNEGKVFGQYKCTAHLDAQDLITSLIMDEISHQEQ